MTDSRLSFTARAIILLLGLSLLVMLGVTIKERVSNPHLVTERPTAPQGMGQEQNLLASLMQKVAAEPTNKDALMHLAEHLMATQEWDAAATFAQRAVALDVNDPQPLYMLGVILHNQGKPQEAAATLEKVVALRDDATVRYSLGVLHSYFLQQKDKGRAHWEAGLKDPKISPEMRQAIEEELKKYPLPHQTPKGRPRAPFFHALWPTEMEATLRPPPRRLQPLPGILSFRPVPGQATCLLY